MHSSADTEAHSLAASVQNLMTTPTFILMPKAEGKLHFFCLLSLYGIELYSDSDITFTFNFLSVPLTRNCANHLKNWNKTD
jgi:hypothetical protein